MTELKEQVVVDGTPWMILLTIVLIIGKTVGWWANLSWWWVFCPIWLPFALVGGIIAMLCVIAIVVFIVALIASVLDR